MAIPIPYTIHSEAFRPYKYPVEGKGVKGARFFEYWPKAEEAKLDIEGIIKLLDEAHKEVDQVHLLVFPELALTENGVSDLRQELANRIKPPRHLPIIIAGIRGVKTNAVELSVFFAKKWYMLGQSKHHRWILDRRQIKRPGRARPF
jgi:hypothetical protein